MNKEFKIPPHSPKELTTLEELQKRLESLIGIGFKLTGKSRTDGSNNRKMIAAKLEQYPLPNKADNDEYEIIPPKKKGVPKILREFVDTYIVTSGASYNLQVWNRIPSSESLLIKYESGESLKCTDVRLVMTKIDVTSNTVSAIIIVTPQYIESKFGKFGKPTVKHQLLISAKVRAKIYESMTKIMFYGDSKKMVDLTRNDFELPQERMTEQPRVGQIFSLDLIKRIVAEQLVGYKISPGATKNRGQELERKVLELLGYVFSDTDLLYGSFPDIPNQLLEIKVQDTQTVDLGKFSPENEEIVIEHLNLTTFDVRYLIALTNPDSGIIEGIILSPGEQLGSIFSYVSDISYKCQRSIPMAFFEKYKGQVIVNPDY